jgi:hypothetical protein
VGVRQRLAELAGEPALQGDGPELFDLIRGPLVARNALIAVARQHVGRVRLVVLSGLHRLRDGVPPLGHFDLTAEVVEILVRLLPLAALVGREVAVLGRDLVPELKDRLAGRLARLAQLLQHSPCPR